MQQIYDMRPTALLPLRRKACWGFFRPKNPTTSAGFEPANLGTKGQHATPRPTKPLTPNNMNKKINLHFSDFCSAGNSLQFVTTDSKTSYHNLFFRFLSLYSFNFFFLFFSFTHKGGLFCTSHIHFSTSSTIDIAVWRKTQFVHLTAAIKQLFSCQCARRDWNMCVLSSSATFLLRPEWVRSQQKSCHCAPSLRPLPPSPSYIATGKAKPAKYADC